MPKFGRRNPGMFKRVRKASKKSSHAKAAPRAKTTDADPMPSGADSGEESSAGEDIPYRKPDKKLEDDLQDSAANGGEDDEEEVDEYTVEKIIDHKFVQGKLFLEVKWQGYGLDETTWEPDADIGILDEVQKYYRRINGKPVNPKGSAAKKAAGVKRKSIGSDQSPTPAEPAQKSKKAKAGAAQGEMIDNIGDGDSFVAPSGLWEDHLLSVDTIERDAITGTPMGFIMWNSGKKSQHRLPVLYQKCPQKMLAFYESHLHFNSEDDLQTKGKLEAAFPSATNGSASSQKTATGGAVAPV